MPFTPSKYQEAIFEYIKEEPGNLVVKAVAGSGKSTTIIKAMDLIPSNRSILFAAFNVDIVNELKRKIGEKANISVRTLHSLGYSILKRNFRDCKLEVDEMKYAKHLNETYPSISYERSENILALINQARFSVVDSERKLTPIAEKYGIAPLEDDIQIALDCLEWGMENMDTIDYTDMVWLPNVKPMQFFGFFYDFIFIDECQDMNTAQRSLALKCMKNGSRFVAVGDDEQCIYAFMGSDPSSFKKLCSMPNTKQLPLSVTYRCPKRVVEFVSNLSQDIKYDDDAINGSVNFNTSLASIKENDLVLCRNNAPLVRAFIELSKMGRKVKILGKKYSKTIKDMVRSCNTEEIHGKPTKNNVVGRLMLKMVDERDKVSESKGCKKCDANTDPYILSFYDKICVISEILSHCDTINDFYEKMDTMYGDDIEDAIILSTIHKAKGLESDNVHILCKSLMPSPMAESELELQQERNIQYVAYTRPKITLNFISSKGFEEYEKAYSSHINIDSVFYEIENNKDLME